jgi:CRISPR-associated endonuclease/helicase Cas3
MTCFTIARHAVPVREVYGGLSDLQHAMLHDEHRIRIFSAPTGAGKSYAFQRGVVRDGLRVLFVVPTRRLAANLAAALRRDLAAGGVAEDAIARRIVIWTSDERRRLEAEDPMVRVGRVRVRQLRQSDLAADEGRMILATPEGVAWGLLHPPRPDHGDSALNIADVLRGVDHVVFDEFHTIDPRGLGIAAAVAAITSRVRGGARLTFLSATPIDVRSALVDFGIDPACITSGRETVVTGAANETPGARAVHGDVEIGVTVEDDIPALLDRLAPEIRRCLDGESGIPPRQLVVIYDSKRELHRDKDALAAVLDRFGVTIDERLAINSTDDSVDRDLGAGFTIGSSHDPSAFRVLVATSSVEMGVTFRAGMMVMQPGHSAASFVQRIGRVARGDEPGRVVVAIPSKGHQDPDRRRLLGRLAALPPRVEIGDFVAACLESVVENFTPRDGELEREEMVFARMPARAAWCAALFWAALRRTWTSTTGTRETLDNFRTPKAGRIEVLLRTLEREGSTYAQWARQFVAEATILREIQPSVDIVDPDGNRRTVSWLDYASTAELTAMPTRYDTGRDRLEVFIDEPISAAGNVLSRLGGEYRSYEIETIWPHAVETDTVSHGRAVDEFCERLDKALKSRRSGARRHGCAMKAAAVLVQLTRIVPAPPRERRAGAVAEGSEIV